MRISESLWVTMPEQLQTLFTMRENPDKDAVLEGFPDRKTTWVAPNHANNRSGEFLGELKHPGQQGFNDSGSAARFFFNAVDREEYMILSEHEYEQLPEHLKALFSQVPNPERDEVLDQFPETKSGRSNGNAEVNVSSKDGNIPLRRGTLVPRTDDGSAARFYYCAKASRKERNAGLETSVGEKEIGVGAGNSHPTVKPLALMRYLVRMITPPGGIVLDPFCGSGSTGCAAVQEGFGFIGIEQDEDYCQIAQARIQHYLPIPPDAETDGEQISFLF